MPRVGFQDNIDIDFTLFSFLGRMATTTQRRCDSPSTMSIILHKFSSVASPCVGKLEQKMYSTTSGVK
ncbi:MAG: hypothetical protein WBN72_06325 [Nitrososphaeraceae archaeon]